MQSIKGGKIEDRSSCIDLKKKEKRNLGKTRKKSKG